MLGVKGVYSFIALSPHREQWRRERVKIMVPELTKNIKYHKFVKSSNKMKMVCPRIQLWTWRGKLREEGRRLRSERQRVLSTYVTLGLVPRIFLPLSLPKKKAQSKSATDFCAPKVPGHHEVFPDLCASCTFLAFCLSERVDYFDFVSIMSTLAAHCLCLEPISYLLCLFYLYENVTPHPPPTSVSEPRKDFVHGSNSSTFELDLRLHCKGKAPQCLKDQAPLFLCLLRCFHLTAHPDPIFAIQSRNYKPHSQAKMLHKRQWGDCTA